MKSPRFAILAIVFVSAFLAACQHSYKEVSLKPGVSRSKLRSDAIVYIAIPPDARFKRDLVEDSGELTAAALQTEFARHVKRAYLGRRVETYEDGLATALAYRCTYFVYATIVRWEDRLTEYTARSDRLEIKIDVVDAATAQILDSTLLKGRSRLFTDGGDAPEDLLREPIRSYVASLFQPVYVPSALR